MNIELLNEKEKRYAENLGKNLANSTIKGTINLIDELEELKSK